MPRTELALKWKVPRTDGRAALGACDGAFNIDECCLMLPDQLLLLLLLLCFVHMHWIDSTAAAGAYCTDWLHYRHHCEFTLSFSLWLLDVVVLFGPTHHWWQPWWFSLHRQAASPSSSPSAPSASAPLVAALCTPHTNVLVNELLLKTKTKKRCIASLCTLSLFAKLWLNSTKERKRQIGTTQTGRLVVHCKWK